MSALPPFEFRLRVRYGECDAQGVVFNARYADYVDVAATEYIRALFGNYESLLKRDLDTQVVSLGLQWKASAVYDDVLSVRIQPGRLGTTSFGLTFAFYRHADQLFVASADVVYVMVAVSKRSKATIPDDLRRSLTAGAPGQIVSHAGESVAAAVSPSAV